MIPVPFGDLVECHFDLCSDANLREVVPDGILVEVLLENHHLGVSLPHALTLLPLLNVRLLKKEPRLGGRFYFGLFLLTDVFWTITILFGLQ